MMGFGLHARWNIRVLKTVLENFIGLMFSVLMTFPGFSKPGVNFIVVRSAELMTFPERLPGENLGRAL